MKVTKLTIINDDGQEETLSVKDGTGLFVCDSGEEGKDKVLTIATTNSAVNLQVVKNILKN
jgi:hypothetical protein